MDTLRLPASLESLEPFRMFVLHKVEQLELPMEVTMKVELVLEELLTNVIHYAYLQEGGGDIQVRCFLSQGNCLQITIRDWGSPFDPLALEAPDMTQDLAKREVGGLGVFLVRQMVDEISYSREEESNVLSVLLRV